MKEGAGMVPPMLCLRWKKAFRIRLTGGGYKPPQTVVVKSHYRDVQNEWSGARKLPPLCA